MPLERAADDNRPYLLAEGDTVCLFVCAVADGPQG